MTRNRVTSKEIAKKAGVSPTAVSFAINGKDGISEDTRRHIIATAAQLGLKITPQKKKSHYIALLSRNNMHDLDQLFYTEFNTSIINASSGQPYNIVIVSYFRNEGKILFSDILYSNAISGIIIYGDLENDVISELQSLNIPIVVLDSSRKRSDYYSVSIDYKTVAYNATKYLISLGHRDIAYIENGNSSIHDYNLLAFSGFQKATSEDGITLVTNRIQLDIFDEKSLGRCIDKALMGEKMPTALFCATDYCAILAIRHLHSIGISVPDDISVMGIDDIAISPYIIPALTTIKIDRNEIGRYGFNLMKSLINGEPCDSIRIDSCKLIVRDSVSPPPEKRM